MYIILRPHTSAQEMDSLQAQLRKSGLSFQQLTVNNRAVLFFDGSMTGINIERIQALDCVEEVQWMPSPYPKAGLQNHPQPTVVCIGNAKFGGGHFSIIAGPCAIESEQQLLDTARAVQKAGATVLRGGAFKPRSSPYSFQGLGTAGLELLQKAKRLTGLPIASEIMDEAQLPLFAEVDLLQVGARNMHNYSLLRALGKTEKPILLKRGLSATLEELLLSAEYILAEGNPNVILCERGIRTFEPTTRNTLDLAAVPILQQLTHLPVIVDPSHSTGHHRLVKPMALAATAAGADGLIIEVHPDPGKALSDGRQSLNFSEFSTLTQAVQRIRQIL